MNNWMNTKPARPFDLSRLFDAHADRQLRRLDLVLAALALLLLGLPVALGWLLGRLQRQTVAGRHGQTFGRWHLALPANRLGRLLQHLGVAQWPVLLNILNGDMAWVGPRQMPPAAQASAHPALMLVRPGLVNRWALRQRTAVNYGTELDADLEYVCVRGLRHDLGLLLHAVLLSWLPAPKPAQPGRITVGDVAFDNVSMEQALSQISQMLDGQSAQQVSFVNPACVNIAAGHRGYRRLLARAALVLPDGIGIKIAADLLGQPLRQNVNGTDLFAPLCDLLELRQASLFLLGGQPGVAEKVAQVVQARWPGLRIAGLRDGFFSVADEGAVAAQVRHSQADLLLVARGVPMQDEFIDRHLHQLGVKVAMGVGGLFDFVCGRINRAPVWMRDLGLEWVYRLMQEPTRMWRRYLLGNFTFLARMLMQRLGLRQPAADVLRADAQAATLQPAMVEAPPTGIRTVLFLTASAPADVPVPEHDPAALLPLGSSSLIEQTLSQLSALGVGQVDLVVSARPEALRQLLGDGERWGLRLRWHLVKDASKPYGVLRSLGLQRSERVLLGHADCRLGSDLLAALLAQHQVLAYVDAAEGLLWSGWGSLSPAVLADLSPHFSREALGSLLCHRAAEVQICEASALITVRSAAQLLQAQRRVLDNPELNPVPATWIRCSWGAHSPEAVVQAGAQIEGPVLIGPGCFVGHAAHIGPYTVLARDVLVSAGASLTNSLVLADTYVGAGLELDTCIAQGGAVQNLRLNVRTVLPESDGLLLDMQPQRRRASHWPGRAVALLACLAFAPLSAADALLRRLRGLPLRWRSQPVVTGRDPHTGAIRLGSLRMARPGHNRPSRLLAQYGAWLDVAAGRRAWFGVRPRSASDWYALGRDWQALLLDAPLGCLYARADSDALGQESQEAGAAADIYFAVQNSTATRLRLFWHSLGASSAV